MIRIGQTGEVRGFRMARTFLGRSLYWTAAYYVDGLLIDSGCAHTAVELADALTGLPLTRLVNTHSHEDHIGGNAVIWERFHVRPLIHPPGLPVLAETRREKRLHPYQRLMWGYPEPSRGEVLGDNVRTTRHVFQVVATPGHSPDHVCLFEPDHGWLFTGDAYIGGRDRALRADCNIWRIIASLKKLAALNPGVLFSGSGSVRPNPVQDLKDKIEYLEQAGHRVRDLDRQGFNRSRIRKILFGREPNIYYITLGHFSGLQLVRSFIEDCPDESRRNKNGQDGGKSSQSHEEGGPAGSAG
nr:MBL fold metallo-hydrolase [uncultured Sphaerochaeta sp.]